jgi:hypothetical protein
MIFQGKDINSGKKTCPVKLIVLADTGQIYNFELKLLLQNSETCLFRSILPQRRGGAEKAIPALCIPAFCIFFL